MENNLTMISGNNLGFLMGRSRTAREIIDFIKEGAMFRDFGYMMRQLRPASDLTKILTQGLSDITGENYASVSKKVRNWMNGKNVPKNRETIFRICFVLKLNEDEANLLTGRLSDMGIHYRDPSELAYAYAFRTGKNYTQAQELKKRAVAIADEEAAGMAGPAPEVYTRQIKAAFSAVHTDEEFDLFFRENGAKLGTMHDSAYRKFIELLDDLQNPASYGGPEGLDRSYTLAEVIQEYMQLNVPVRQKKASKAGNAAQTRDLDIYQKIVRKYWPSESTLIRMRNRVEDVDRKTMLLLYLATESFDDEIEEGDIDFLEDFEDDPETLLEIRIENMRIFLDEYGMNPLDPGNPFDFLLIYAMRTEEDEEARVRMEEVLDLLYSESEEE